MTQAGEPSIPAFLAGGGEMGVQLRAFDWPSIGLGAPREWPVALRSALAICLSSSFPTCVYWGRDLRLLYNDAWSLIPGERHPWCLGRAASEVWADIWEVVGPQFQQVLDTGRGFAAYNQLLPMQRHGRVQETYWTYSFTPLFDEQEQVVGILNQGHETTAFVLGERERQSEVARLRELFDRAPGSVALLSGPRHVFEMANTAYLQLVGPREIIGKPLAEALPEIPAQGFVALLDRVYATGQTYRGEGVRVGLHRQAGAPMQERVVDFVYQPMRDVAGHVTGILVQSTDVTERERALQELREADTRKDLFLATLAHELRNPLAPLRNGLQILKLRAGADERLAATREMMERQLRHLVHLVDDLLDVSRISTGKIQLRHARVDLRTVLARAVEATSAAFEQKAQFLDVDAGQPGLAVDGDDERLTQVFTNLLANAAKLTPRVGRITLRLRPVGDRVEVSVADDGIGIPPEALDRVFEMFAQVQGGEAHTEGLGIGLALSSQLVQMHGGVITAQSGGVGKGSCFTVSLPLAAPVQAAAVNQAAQAAPARRHPGALRILLVDDNADAGDSLAALLQLEGHEVTVLRDGAAAVEAYARLLPDVVLMDVGMPGMDGIEAARRIRALPEGQAARIAALTGWGQDADRDRTRAAGMWAHLTKPVDIDALLKLLRDP